MKRTILSLFTIFALGAGACARNAQPAGQAEADGQQGTQPSAQTADVEAVITASTLWQIKAHHRAALALAALGDFSGAVVHTRHPIDELMALVREEIGEHGGSEGAANAEAIDAAAAAAAKAATKKDEAALRRAAKATAQAADEAVAALPGAGTEAFTGSVVAELLSTASHEYEEAVAGGGGVNLEAEYQDAYGIMTVAHALYVDELAAAIQASAPEEAEEIEEGWEQLERALPEVMPPKRPAPAEDVQSATDLIARELEETVGARVSDAVDASDVWESIDGLLTEVQEAYEAGDREEAAELVAQAYLENYELVEVQVIEVAPEINAELEPLLGADLRASIRDRVPAPELAGMIERARALLKQAEEAVGGGQH